MSDLTSLIRLHKWQLDEKRRALAELEALRTRLAEEARRLDEELERERAVAEQSPFLSIGLGGYIRSMLQRRQRLADSLAQVEHRLAAAKESISLAFAEVKKYEILQAERERRDRLRRQRREAATMDEIGASRFQRKTVDPDG